MARAGTKPKAKTKTKVEPQRYENLPGRPVVFNTGAEVIDYVKAHTDLTPEHELFLEQCFTKMAYRDAYVTDFYNVCKTLPVGLAFEGCQRENLHHVLQALEGREGIPYQAIAFKLLKGHYFKINGLGATYGEEGARGASIMSVLSPHLDKKALLTSTEENVALNAAVAAVTLGWEGVREDVDRVFLGQGQISRLFWYADHCPESFEVSVDKAFKTMDFDRACEIYRGESGALGSLPINLKKFRPKLHEYLTANAKTRDLPRLYRMVKDEGFRQTLFEKMVVSNNLGNLGLLARQCQGEHRTQVVEKIRALVEKGEHIVQFLSGDLDDLLPRHMGPFMMDPFMQGPFGMHSMWGRNHRESDTRS